MTQCHRWFRATFHYMLYLCMWHKDSWILKMHCFLCVSGVIKTEFLRNLNPLLRLLTLPFSKLFFLDTEGGAQTTLHCALQVGLEPLSGRYFSSCGLQEASAAGRDDALAKKLWEVSERLCGLSWEWGMKDSEEQKWHQMPCELLLKVYLMTAGCHNILNIGSKPY